MKIAGLLLIGILFITGCKTAKHGCAGARYSGERFKSAKFKWE